MILILLNLPFPIGTVETALQTRRAKQQNAVVLLFSGAIGSSS
jgi:hypothetical protein